MYITKQCKQQKKKLNGSSVSEEDCSISFSVISGRSNCYFETTTTQLHLYDILKAGLSSQI